MPPRRALLPREGFTADVVQSIVQSTLLNPVLTLPLLLFARYHPRGRGLTKHYPYALNPLTWCLGLGIARWVNGVLNRGALNNWTRADFKWDKEVVVVTGGSDGIGKLLVKLLAEKGIKVVVMDVKRPTYELSENVHYVKVDLASLPSIEEACKTVKSTYGNPTVLVNNAGVFNTRSCVADIPDDALTKLVAVNQLAHYRLVRQFLPSMVAANHGMVVMMASLAAYLTPPSMTSYCGTKAAAVALHEGLTAELRERYGAPGVRTVLVVPNFTRTKMLDGLANNDRFLNPTLEAATVADAAFLKIVSGDSGVVGLPRTVSWFGMTVRSWPWWMQRGSSRALKDACH